MSIFRNIAGALGGRLGGGGLERIKSLLARRRAAKGVMNNRFSSAGAIGAIGGLIGGGSNDVDNYMDSFDQKTMQRSQFATSTEPDAPSVNSGAEKMQAIRANEFMNNASRMPRPFAPAPKVFGANEFEAEASSDPFNTFEGPTASERAEQARILKMKKFNLGLSHQTRGSTVDDAFTRMGGTLGQEARTDNIAATDYGALGHTMSNNLKYANLFAGTGSGIYLKKQK